MIKRFGRSAAVAVAVVLTLIVGSASVASAGPVAVSPPAYSNIYCTGGTLHFTVRPSAGNSQTTITNWKFDGVSWLNQGTYTIRNYANFTYWAGFPWEVVSIGDNAGQHTERWMYC